MLFVTFNPPPHLAQLNRLQMRVIGVIGKNLSKPDIFAHLWRRLLSVEILKRNPRYTAIIKMADYIILSSNCSYLMEPWNCFSMSNHFSKILTNGSNIIWGHNICQNEYHMSKVKTVILNSFDIHPFYLSYFHTRINGNQRTYPAISQVCKFTSKEFVLLACLTKVRLKILPFKSRRTCLHSCLIADWKRWCWNYIPYGSLVQVLRHSWLTSRGV